MSYISAFDHPPSLIRNCASRFVCGLRARQLLLDAGASSGLPQSTQLLADALDELGVGARLTQEIVRGNLVADETGFVGSVFGQQHNGQGIAAGFLLEPQANVGALDLWELRVQQSHLRLIRRRRGQRVAARVGGEYVEASLAHGVGDGLQSLLIRMRNQYDVFHAWSIPLRAARVEPVAASPLDPLAKWGGHLLRSRGLPARAASSSARCVATARERARAWL